MNYKKIATGISWVLHPFLLPVYLMAVLLTMTAFSHYPPNVKFYLLWVVALYAIVIPLLSLGVLRSLGRISDYRIDDRRERFLPLLVGAVCYVLAALVRGGVLPAHVWIPDLFANGSLGSFASVGTWKLRISAFA